MSAVTDYIKQLQSYEEYAFSWSELLENSNAPEPTLRKELMRLVERNELLNVRKGFYLILPPRYLGVGKLPLQLYVDKLFRHLNKPYYVAFYSAAAFHGASHQQIQQDYIATVSPALRDIDKGKTRIRFFKISNWPQKNIIQRKSDAGMFNLSSPALTAVDLINYPTKLGGLNRMLANLEELVEEITIQDITDLLSWYPHKSAIQRFGYLLEELQGKSERTEFIFQFLNQENFYPVLLSPKNNQKAGSTGNRWKIDVNLELESDL